MGHAALGCSRDSSSKSDGHKKGLEMHASGDSSGELQQAWDVAFEDQRNQVMQSHGVCDKCCRNLGRGSGTSFTRGALPNIPGYSAAGTELFGPISTPAKFCWPESNWWDRSLVAERRAESAGSFHEVDHVSVPSAGSFARAALAFSPGDSHREFMARTPSTAVNSASSVRTSPEARSTPSLGYRAPHTSASPEQPLYAEARRETAIASLERAALSQDANMLRAALAEGERAGLDNRDLEPLRAFLQEQDSKVAARKQLVNALNTRRPKALHDAIQQGLRVGLHEQELLPAKSFLAIEESKQIARTNLEIAFTSGNVEMLRHAILDCEDLGINRNSKLLAAARALLAMDDKRSVALMGLQAAVTEGGADRLRFALEEGRIAGLTADEMRTAKLELAKIEERDQDDTIDSLLRNMTEDASSSQRAGGGTAAVGIFDHSQAASSPQDKNAADSALQAHARMQLFEAVSSRRVDALHAAILGGIRAGLSPDTLRSPLDILNEEEAKQGKIDTIRSSSDWYTGFTSLQIALQQSGTALIKASWLMHRAKTKGVLPRRQELPPAAVWDAEELAESLQSSPPVLIVAVSYRWRTAAHPDPHGELLETLGNAFGSRLDSGSKGPSDDMAVFIDWCSLHQPPWMAADNAHQRTAVWFERIEEIAGRLETATTLSQRCWPLFEFALGSLATPGHMLLDLAQFSEESCFLEGAHKEKTPKEGCHAKRIPPMLPEAFSSAMESRQLAVASDRTFLQDKYKKAFTEVMSSLWELSYHREDWGDPEVEQLARALPYCPAVERLNLSNNRISDVGAKALANVIPDCCPHFRTLRLGGNRIGDEGQRLLRAAWLNGGRDDSRLSF